MEELLKNYAALIVEIGLALQKRQKLIISTPVECRDFALYVEEAAFRAGASDVIFNWSDEKAERIRYDLAPLETFSEFPEWRQKFFMDNANEGAAFLTIAARDPEIFNGIDELRLLRKQRAVGKALIEYRDRMMANKNRWCVISVPTKTWAKKVFPALNEDEAVKRLWKEIFATVRVGKGRDTIREWKDHIDFLHKAADFLNEQQFVSLHYTNALGTNLTIELPEGHIWAGGSEKAADGIYFAANLPTEEVYTLPTRTGVNGIVYATKPLHYNGKLIENFFLQFEYGKVVHYHADKGMDALISLLKTDEGATHLGEVALVPYDSPISKSGLLFYNTLFDENAACHLALGKAYATCLKGGADMDSMTLFEHGVNDSLVHEDFMVGSADLSITGKKKDGTEIAVFRNGNFACL